jgi:hypothetical protein
MCFAMRTSAMNFTPFLGGMLSPLNVYITHLFSLALSIAGELYGLEKFWAYLKYRKDKRPLAVDPFIQGFLDRVVDLKTFTDESFKPDPIPGWAALQPKPSHVAEDKTPHSRPRSGSGSSSRPRSNSNRQRTSSRNRTRTLSGGHGGQARSGSFSKSAREGGKPG